MEIKLVRMRDLGTAKAQGLPLSPSICNSALNRELTSRVRQEKDASSARCQNVIWARSRHFHIKATCEGCCTVLTCKTHFFFVCFVLLFSLFLLLHLLLFFLVLHFDLCSSTYLSVPLASRHFIPFTFYASVPGDRRGRRRYVHDISGYKYIINVHLASKMNWSVFDLTQHIFGHEVNFTVIMW